MDDDPNTPLTDRNLSEWLAARLQDVTDHRDAEACEHADDARYMNSADALRSLSAYVRGLTTDHGALSLMLAISHGVGDRLVWGDQAFKAAAAIGFAAREPEPPGRHDRDLDALAEAVAEDAAQPERPMNARAV